MSISIEELQGLHEQVSVLISDFSSQQDYKSRLALVRASKVYMSKYLKLSCALLTWIHDQSASTDKLKVIFRRSIQDLNSDAKKIVGLYLQYGHGCDNADRFKFQMAFSEAITLLELRLKLEKEHIFPEYQLLSRQNQPV